MSSCYDFNADNLAGQSITLSDFRGQVVLIVNTASRCGFTPQYQGLQQLHQQYSAQGFSVLAFPCNQFGAQEPGSASEITEFCERQFAVTFPVFAKIDVNGRNAHPLFVHLTQNAPGFLGSRAINGISPSF